MSDDDRKRAANRGNGQTLAMTVLDGHLCEAPLDADAEEESKGQVVPKPSRDMTIAEFIAGAPITLEEVLAA